MDLSLCKIRAGFTLVELLVVIIIVSLLSALTLGALRSGGIRAKEDSARSFVVHISESLLELFEELDDQGSTTEVVNGEYKIRWQIPVSRNDATILSSGLPILPFGSIYGAYASNINAGSSNESAECLYMIMTQTGYFGDFLETLHETQIGDLDSNGASDVFVDTWGTPIRLEFSPERPEPDLNANNVLEPFGHAHQEDHNANGVRDTNAVLSIQNLPIIRSAGVDQEFGTDDDIMSIDLTNGIFLQ